MSTKSSVPVIAGISGGTLSPNRSRAMCNGAYSRPGERHEGLHPIERRVALDALPVSAVHPRQPAHPTCHLIDRHRPGRVARVGPAGDDVLHDHQEVTAILIDDRRVDRWMVEWQNDSRGEQPGLVIEPAGQGDEVGVLGVDSLGEHRRRPGTSRVGQLEPGTAVGPVVAQHDRDIVDLDARKMTGERRRHPFRGDLVPIPAEWTTRQRSCATSGSCRRRPAA